MRPFKWTGVKFYKGGVLVGGKQSSHDGPGWNRVVERPLTGYQLKIGQRYWWGNWKWIRINPRHAKECMTIINPLASYILTRFSFCNFSVVQNWVFLKNLSTIPADAAAHARGALETVAKGLARGGGGVLSSLDFKGDLQNPPLP